MRQGWKIEEEGGIIYDNYFFGRGNFPLPMKNRPLAGAEKAMEMYEIFWIYLPQVW